MTDIAKVLTLKERVKQETWATDETDETDKTEHTEMYI